MPAPACRSSRSPPRVARPCPARRRFGLHDSAHRAQVLCGPSSVKRLVQALHERGGILELPAFGEDGLLRIAGNSSARNARRRSRARGGERARARIQLEARNRRRRRLARGLQQLAHLVAEVVLVEHEARGGLAQRPPTRTSSTRSRSTRSHPLQELRLLVVRRGLCRRLGAELRRIGARRGARL